MRSPRSDPPAPAARLGHAVRLGLSAESRARGGPRSAPARDRAARRARRTGGGGAGRRSGLGRLARGQGAHARRQAARAAARFLLCAQSGDAEPASPLQGRRRHHRACDGDVLPRALPLRRPGRAGERPRQAGRQRQRLAQSRARLAAAGRPRRWRPRGFCGRAHCAAGRAWTRAGPVVDAAAYAAGERRHADATPRPLPAHRSRARARARGAHGACDHRPCRRHGWGAAAGGRSRTGACLFRRIRGHRGALPRAPGRAAHRRARLRRLGHPRRRGCHQRPARHAARRA